MSKINVLDEATINRIAAGEVIERPKAVVKELVENAIDAKASAITVEIKNGGISLVRVTDDGEGIEKDDIPLAFQRHCTGKISTAEDLFRIHSLGFRGEALSSIAAVARVELITKRSEDFLGHRYLIEGGEEIAMEEVGAPDGTTFLVKELFYNTPARRKFLKSAQTEAAQIIDVVEKTALSHPEISVKLFINGKLRLQTAGNNNVKDIIYNIYGKEIAKGLIPVDCETEAVHIRGFIGQPLIAKANRSFENCFVNGRYVKTGLLTAAIEEGYHGHMMTGRFPFTCLFLEVPSETVDVNIHPTKMEIKFLEEDAVRDTLFRTVREALGGTVLTPELRLRKEEDAPLPVRRAEPFEKKRKAAEENRPGAGIRENGSEYGGEVGVSGENMKPTGESWRAEPLQSGPLPLTDAELTEEKKEQVQHFLRAQKPEIDRSGRSGEGTIRNEKSGQLQELPVGRTSPTDAHPAPDTDHPERPVHGKEVSSREGRIARGQQVSLFDMPDDNSMQRIHVIGQAFRTYWIVEVEDQLYLIDQHAAHEKVLFERFLKDFRQKRIAKQTLAVPIVIRLTAEEIDLLEKHRQRFEDLGFEMEAFGEKDYALRAVPYNLYKIDRREWFEEMLTDLLDSKAVESNEKLYLKLATMSCKAAIKGNQTITEHQLRVLIRDMLDLENPFQCPHGRPTAIRMSKKELDKKFARIV